MENKVLFLMADDDEDDRDLTKRAFDRSRLRNDLRFVDDGEELIDYLLHRNAYSEPGSAPRPGVILLDLNMPRMDGREALKIIKSHEDLRSIPVVVMTTSTAEADMLRSYNLGANSYVPKPVDFQSLMKLVHDLEHYWVEIVVIPGSKNE